MFYEAEYVPFYAFIGERVYVIGNYGVGTGTIVSVEGVGYTADPLFDVQLDSGETIPYFSWDFELLTGVGHE